MTWNPCALKMLEGGEDLMYYLALYNEPHRQPPLPKGAEEGILKGLYRLSKGGNERRQRAHIVGSGPLLQHALEAQEMLAEHHDVAADVWSATSYQQLRLEALEAERYNRLHPQEPARQPYVTELLESIDGPVVAVTDSMKEVPDQISRWVPAPYLPLGTDGFGRSDTRDAPGLSYISSDILGTMSIAAKLIREARRAAGMTQGELARRSRTSQSAVAAYESAAKVPTTETLDRLLRAAGVRIATQPLAPRRRRGAALRKLLHDHRDEIMETAARHGARNVRVFGSVARDEEAHGSDVDLLVDMEPGYSLLDQVRLRRALRELLGVEVDVVTSGGLLERDAAILEQATSI